MLQTQSMSGITAATRRKWKKESNTFMFFIKIISHGPFPNYSGYMARSVYVPLKAFNTPFEKN